MRKHFLIVFCCLCSLLCLPAANTRPVVIRVNGNEVSKVVTEISMDDDDLTLKWNDNTKLTGRLARLMVDLTKADINEALLMNVSGILRDQMSIEGLTKGTPLYIYNLQGQLLLQQPVDKDLLSIDIHSLNTGIYLLKNNNTILKFVKK